MIVSSAYLRGSDAEPPDPAKHLGDLALGAPPFATAVVRVARTATGFEYEGEYWPIAPGADAALVEIRASVVLSTVLPLAGPRKQPEELISRRGDLADVPVPSR